MPGTGSLFWKLIPLARAEFEEYRGTRHLFGNTLSPAFAIMGLHYAVWNPGSAASDEVSDFMTKDVYVDDGIMSTECVLRTQGALFKYNIRLHKITSNSPDVLRNFPEQDLSKTSATTFGSSQQTLGLTWEITEDKLVVNSLVPDKPFTKRGVLAVVNSIFDLLGFVTPVLLTGTLLQRQLITSKENSNPKVDKFSWDDDLPAEYAGAWSKWKIQEELTFSTI